MDYPVPISRIRQIAGYDVVYHLRQTPSTVSPVHQLHFTEAIVVAGYDLDQERVRKQHSHAFLDAILPFCRYTTVQQDVTSYWTMQWRSPELLHFVHFLQIDFSYVDELTVKRLTKHTIEQYDRLKKELVTWFTSLSTQTQQTYSVVLQRIKMPKAQ